MKLILATVCLLAWFNSISVNGQITKNVTSSIGFTQRDVLPNVGVRRLENQPVRLARQLGGGGGSRLPSNLYFVVGL